MAIPLVPWEPHCFPSEIQSELRRRSINRGLKPIVSEAANWSKDDDTWNDYRGPMTSWVRVCSNGYGLETRNLPSFIMYGGKDFATSYGFNQGNKFAGNESSTPNTTILGYTSNGRAHVLENDINTSQYPIHVPAPEIEKISATIQKELLRRVRIEWTCFSLKQMEYLTPYFLIPGITMTVEWGWNHFNMQSLLDLDDTDKLSQLYNNPYPLYTKNVLDSRGNYEVVFGYVTNFEWSIDGNKIKCVTEVTSKDRLYAGMSTQGNMMEADSALTDKDQQNPVTGKAKRDPQKTVGITDSLKTFVNQYIDKFKDVIDNSKTSDQIVELYTHQVQTDRQPLYGIVQHLKQYHPATFKDYLFGIYYGRDEKTVSHTTNLSGGTIAGTVGSTKITTTVSSDDYANSDDWDRQASRDGLWLNMGLVIEIINYFCTLKGVKNKPLFRVDVDDAIITGHPNLISTNGKDVLIPNALSPKYFAGRYGSMLYKGDVQYERQMQPATNITPTVFVTELDENDPTPNLKWAGYRLRQLFLPYQTSRDDISKNVINVNRLHFGDPQGRFEFPFSKDLEVAEGGEVRKYGAWFTGYFKNLYLSSDAFKRIVNKATTFQEVIRGIFDTLNEASSDFWKFKLDAGTGRQSSTDYAAMKIVDENLTQYTSNVGTVFTFDYYNADGLLQSINFRPTLTNAQAIRTIYAPTNLTNKSKTVLSGYNELLDYKFRDRLKKIADESGNEDQQQDFEKSSWRDSIGKLQALKPPSDSYQVTTKGQNGEKIIFRLAIPKSYSDVLALMLDDNNKGHNPRYTGIMPGIQAEFTVQGIAGIRTFAMFRVRGLPEPYSEKNIIFRVVNCNDTIQNGQWVTHIVAGVIPLRGYFASKLGLSPKVDIAPTKSK